MEQLTLSDLCVIIPLLEKELNQIHADIESDDDDVSDDAGEISVPYGNTASKLENIYKSMWSEGSNYPSYDELVRRK